MHVSSQNQQTHTNVDLTRVLLLFSVALFAVSMGPYREALTGVMVSSAVGLLVGSAFLGPSPRRPVRETTFWLLAASVGVGFLFGSVEGVVAAGPAYSILVLVLGGTALWMVRPGQNLSRSRSWLIAVLGLSVILVIAVVTMLVLEKPMIDVLEINEAGAEALAQGENPYVSVVVVDSSPFAAEGDIYSGYTYPPLTLVAYSGSQWLTGDTRWVNLIAVALFALLLLRPWARRTNQTTVYAAMGFLAIILLPDLAYLLQLGWTEPIALPFLVGAVLNWRRRPFASAVLLGLAFATKQYFVMLAPLVVFWNDDWRWRRTTIVGAVALATMLPVLALDATAFWDAVIAPAFEAGFRPDSVNLIALGVETPRWIALALATGLSVVLGRRGGGAASFALSSAAVLSAVFLFGTQAFANYWLVVVALELAAFLAIGDDLSGVSMRIDEPQPPRPSIG